jgi:hypothetical protein
MGLGDIANFLTRGAEAQQGQTPSQAATDKIAKGLGFPETLTDRFGDVIGTRKRRFSDFVRDAAIAGAAGGDPTAVLKMHNQVADNYAAAVERQRERAEQEEEKRRSDNDEMMNIMQLAREHGRNGGNAVAAFKQLSKEAGVEASPLLAKILTDEQQIRDEDFARINEALEQGGNLKDIVVNSKEGLERIGALQDLRRTDLTLSKDFAELQRIRQQNEAREIELGIARTRTPFEQAMEDAVAEVVANPRTFQAKDVDGNPIPMDPKQIRRLARQLVRARGIQPQPGDDFQDPGVKEAITGQPEQLGIPQQGALPPGATRSVTTTPSTGQAISQTQVPVGLPQAGAQSRFKVEEVR